MNTENPKPLGEILGDFSMLEFERLCPGCGRAKIAHPGICTSCGQMRAESERRAQLSALCARIPERFRWCRLEGSLTPPGESAAVASSRAVQEVVRWMDSAGPLLVLRGPTRSGKSVLAAAVLRRFFEGGNYAGHWLPCQAISPEHCDREQARDRLQSVSNAPMLVLDDLGQDLDGAPAGSGLSALRGARMRSLIHRRHELARVRTVVTTALDDTQIVECYGDDIRGRLLEARRGVLVLRMGGSHGSR